MLSLRNSAVLQETVEHRFLLKEQLMVLFFIGEGCPFFVIYLLTHLITRMIVYALQWLYLYRLNDTTNELKLQ